ncbi:hypothetical protein CBOM_07017 [Ceraceosorus bombacis]|uniref:Uncharacterized protein n=1 Tax=Ceraceosorus bombacis TaxID=401625 RepID=A0A0P1BKE0_9BASI|nr:hypothetical protein CBOM_07017 [Ceraceosorus bombacis]
MPCEGSSCLPFSDLTNHRAKRAVESNSCQPTVAKKLRTAQSSVAGSLYATSLHTPWGTEGAEPDSEDDNVGIDYPYDVFSESDSEPDERPNYYEQEFLDWASSDDEGKLGYDLYSSDDEAGNDKSTAAAAATVLDHQPVGLQSTMEPQASRRHARKRHAAALAYPSGPKAIEHLSSLEEALVAAQRVANQLRIRSDVKAMVNSKGFLQKFVQSSTAHSKLCCLRIADQSCRVKAIGLQDGRSMVEEDGGRVYKGTFFDEEGEPTHRYTGMTTNFARRYREHVVARLYSPLVHYDAAQEAKHCSYRALAIVSKAQYNNSEYAHLLGCLEFIWTIVLGTWQGDKEYNKIQGEEFPSPGIFGVSSSNCSGAQRVVPTGHKQEAARASALNPLLSPHFAALVDAEYDRLRATSPADLELVKGRMLVAKVAYRGAVATLLRAGRYDLRLCCSGEHNRIQASNLYGLVVPAHLRRILLKKLPELQDSGVAVVKLKLVLPSAQKASPTDFFAGSSLRRAHLFAGIQLQLQLPDLAQPIFRMEMDRAELGQANLKLFWIVRAALGSTFMARRAATNACIGLPVLQAQCKDTRCMELLNGLPVIIQRMKVSGSSRPSDEHFDVRWQFFFAEVSNRGIKLHHRERMAVPKSLLANNPDAKAAVQAGVPVYLRAVQGRCLLGFPGNAPSDRCRVGNISLEFGTVAKGWKAASGELKSGKGGQLLRLLVGCADALGCKDGGDLEAPGDWVRSAQLPIFPCGCAIFQLVSKVFGPKPTLTLKLTSQRSKGAFLYLGNPFCREWGYGLPSGRVNLGAQVEAVVAAQESSEDVQVWLRVAGPPENCGRSSEWIRLSTLAPQFIRKVKEWLKSLP